MDTRRWPLAEALPVAESLRNLLAQGGDPCEIVGSARRRTPDVGDIDMLCLPRAASGFGQDALDELLRGSLFPQGILRLRLNTKGVPTYGPLNKYLVHIPSGIPVDIYSADSSHWGAALAIRTGPAARNVRAMARLKQQGMKGYIYGITAHDGSDIAIPTEVEYFKCLGWPYQPPEARRD